MYLFLRMASLVALLTTATAANAIFTGDVTGGGVFTDDVSSADGWLLNNAAANGVDFWTFTVNNPSTISIDIDADIDFGISLYFGAVADDLGIAFDNAADFIDPLTSELGSFIAGTPNIGVAGSSLADVFLGAAGIYTIAVGGADFGFNDPYAYTMTVDISSVPAPATLWLTASGLIGLCGWLKKDKKPLA